MKRTVTQIAIDHDNNLVMLANDGTVWEYRSDKSWFAYPELPQPGSVEDEFRKAEIIQPVGSTRIEEAIDNACRCATSTGRSMALYHNYTRFLVRPGDDPQHLLALRNSSRSNAVIALPTRKDDA